MVGIFGKDNIGFKSKAVHLNGTIGKEVFKIDFLDSMFKKKDVHDFSVSMLKFVTVVFCFAVELFLCVCVCACLFSFGSSYV